MLYLARQTLKLSTSMFSFSKTVNEQLKHICCRCYWKNVLTANYPLINLYKTNSLLKFNVQHAMLGDGFLIIKCHNQTIIVLREK